MTIQLNQRLRLMPTILEYIGDDNINSKPCDKLMSLAAATATTTKAKTTIDPNEEDVTNSRRQVCDILSSSLNEDTNISDKRSINIFQSYNSVTRLYLNYAISYFSELSALLFHISIRIIIPMNHFITNALRKKVSNKYYDWQKASRRVNMDRTNFVASSSSLQPSSSFVKQKFSQRKVLSSFENLSTEITSLLRSLCKRLVIILIMISFLFIGLNINLVQFILYVTLYPVNRRLYQHINYYLIYTILSPVMTIAYYWTNIKLDIRVAKSELLKQTKDPMLGLVVLNHTYEIDWLVCAMLGDQLDNLGAYKTVSKAELKYLPIIGWMNAMSQMLFVERDWSKDKLTLGEGLNKLLDYKQTMIGLFCEGTRLTPEKFEASVKYAIANNLKPLKHHLLPRPRGFSYCVQHLMKMKQSFANRDSLKEIRDSSTGYSDQEAPFRIFNAQLMIPTRPTFGSLLRGDSFQADFYIEEVERSRFANLTEQSEFDQLLYDIYQRKDEFVDEYNSNGKKFSTGYKFQFKRKMSPLVLCIMGFLLTYSVLIKLAMVYSSSMIFWLSLLAMVASSLTLLSKYDKESRSRYSQHGNRYLKKLSVLNHPKEEEEEELSISKEDTNVDLAKLNDDDFRRDVNLGGLTAPIKSVGCIKAASIAQSRVAATH